MITPQKQKPDVGALSAMIAEGEWTTVRGDTASGHGRRGAITLHPDWKDLEYATSLWRRSGGAVFVIEHRSYPIAGWAAVTGAFIVPGWTRTSPLTDEERKALEELQDAGYKGYSDDSSQLIARGILQDAPALRRKGRPWVLSALIGLGMRHSQVERLPSLPGVVTQLDERRGRRRNPPRWTL